MKKRDGGKEKATERNEITNALLLCHLVIEVAACILSFFKLVSASSCFFITGPFLFVSSIIYRTGPCFFFLPSHTHSIHLDSFRGGKQGAIL